MWRSGFQPPLGPQVPRHDDPGERLPAFFEAGGQRHDSDRWLACCDLLDALRDGGLSGASDDPPVDQGLIRAALESEEALAIDGRHPEVRMATLRALDTPAPDWHAGLPAYLDDLLSVSTMQAHGGERRSMSDDERAAARDLLDRWSRLSTQPELARIAWQLIGIHHNSVGMPGLIHIDLSLAVGAPDGRWCDRAFVARHAARMATSLSPAMADRAGAQRAIGMASARWSDWLADAAGAPGWRQQTRLRLWCPAAPAAELAAWLMPWEPHAKRVRHLSLEHVEQVEGVPSSLRPWIAVLEIRACPAADRPDLLSQAWAALPNLRTMQLDAAMLPRIRFPAGQVKIGADGRCVWKLDRRPAALTSYDLLRSALVQEMPAAQWRAWDALDRHVHRFSTLQRHRLLDLAAMWIDECELDWPRLPRIVEALLQDNAAMACCQEVITDDELDPEEILRMVEEKLGEPHRVSAAPPVERGRIDGAAGPEGHGPMAARQRLSRFCHLLPMPSERMPVNCIPASEARRLEKRLMSLLPESLSRTEFSYFMAALWLLSPALPALDAVSLGESETRLLADALDLLTSGPASGAAAMR